MKTMRKIFGILLTASLILTLASTSVSASAFIDAHGNEIELDDSLEAYAEAALAGANDAARKGETNLGDLWTDALRWFAVSGKINGYFEEDDVAAGNTAIATDADHIVALWNGGNLRDDIPAGKFGAEELAKVLPYPNRVAVVYMTGAQLQEALEAASQALPYSAANAAACAAFMQVSGLKYTLDQSKAYDAGEAYGSSWFRAKTLGRVTITEVGGKAFDAAATYAVVTSNANYNGMDSSYIFKEAVEANEKSTITTAVVRDVVWMYINEALENIVKEATYAQAQGRITLIGAPAEANPVVQPSNQRLTVDGEEKAAEVYNVGNANYFKLRDIAALLNDTDSRFSVGYDRENRTIDVKTGEAYTLIGGELAIGADKSASAVKSSQTIRIDGETVALTAYNIGGNNFFGLRALGEALGFDVDYDAATRTMLVTSR